MASQVIVVTTPDVLALRGVRRMRELWKRLGVREDEDVKIVLNQASRRREIQPDLARKVVGDTMAQTTIPADFNALEAAVNTGSPSRMEDNKLRGAFESLAVELDVVPHPDAERPRDDEPRGLIARLGGERGQTTAEFMGLLPIILIIFFGLWQMALTGFTYVVAGHAAREGARQLAVDSSDTGKMPPYREAARKDLPGGWREHAKIEKRGDVTVSVRLKVPVLIPAFRSPIDGRHDRRHRRSRTSRCPTAKSRRPGAEAMKRFSQRRARPGLGRADRDAVVDAAVRADRVAAAAGRVDRRPGRERGPHRQPRRGARRRRREGGSLRGLAGSARGAEGRRPAARRRRSASGSRSSCPGSATSSLRATRSAILPSYVGLRDRIVAAGARGDDGSPDGVGYYRRRLLEEVDLNEIAVLSEEQRRARLERVVGRMVSREGPVLSTAERARLIRRVVDEAVGLGVLEPLLADDTVTEIMVNGTDEIYVERDGRIERADISFSDEAQLFQTIDRIVSTVNRRVDESSPMVDARLPSGERVNVIIPPLALRGPTMTIRRFPRLFTIDELIRIGSLDRADRRPAARARARAAEHRHLGRHRRRQDHAAERALERRARTASGSSPSRTTPSCACSSRTSSRWRRARPTSRAAAR